MLTFVIILAIASSAIEMMFAAKIPALRRAAKKYKLVNLIASLALSYILGAMFGAAGLIAMTAAIFSTILSIPGYIFLEWAYDSPEAQKHGGNLIQYHKDRWKTVMSDFLAIIYKVLRVITFPIWATRSLITKYRELKVRIHTKFS